MVSDKLVYDFIGFSCLSVYCIAMYYVDSVRKEYRDHYNGNNPKVTLNDVCFAVHAVLFTFVQMGQMGYYNGLSQLPSKLCLISASIVLFLIILYLLLCLYIDSNVFIMLYWLNFISYVKIGITMVKYIPQALLNYTRKSTVGWSITACLLDLIGSTMSMLQLFLDCNDTNDWSGLVGDIVKFLLGLLSLGFDIIFMVQHYILYGDSTYSSLNGDEKRPLVDDEEEGNISDKGNERENAQLHSVYNPPLLSQTPLSNQAPSTDYVLGQKVLYTSSSGLDTYIGEVVGVHHDAPDGIPYYTIRYNTNDLTQRELQTDGNRLRIYSKPSENTSFTSTPDNLIKLQHTDPSLHNSGPIYETNESIWE